MDRNVREAVEVVIHPFSMNKEGGFWLSRVWKYFICALKLPRRKPESTKLRGAILRISTSLGSLVT
jgi:hypothetical protein